MKKNLMVALALALQFATAAARETCFDTDVRAGEVVVQIQNSQSCALAGGYLYTVTPIDFVGTNGAGEKLVCAGWTIPSGYTARPRVNLAACLAGRDNNYNWLNAQPLLLNRNPIGGGKVISLPINQVYYGSAALTDPDGDVLSYSTSGVGSGASFSLNSQTGEYAFTPGLDFEGKVDANVLAEDGKGGSAYYSLTFEVGRQDLENRPPLVFEYTDDVTTGYSRVLGLSASDPDGDVVTLKLDVNQPPLHGTIQRAMDVPSPNVYRYTPFANYLGTDYLHVIATDSKGAVDTGVITLNIISADRDGDGIPSEQETIWGLNPDDPTDAALDMDSDGLSNLAEYQAGTKPVIADTDGDGMPDGYERYHSPLNPLLASDAAQDADGDGYSNLAEYQARTDPLNGNFYPGYNPGAWLVPIIGLILQ